MAFQHAVVLLRHPDQLGSRLPLSCTPTNAVMLRPNGLLATLAP
jgi:hypothetical protein